MLFWFVWTKKQGYALPVATGRDLTYRLRLDDGTAAGELDPLWVIEFSDPVLGNQWGRDEITLEVAGRACAAGGAVGAAPCARRLRSGIDMCAQPLLIHYPHKTLLSPWSGRTDLSERLLSRVGVAELLAVLGPRVLLRLLLSPR